MQLFIEIFCEKDFAERFTHIDFAILVTKESKNNLEIFNRSYSFKWLECYINRDKKVQRVQEAAMTVDKDNDENKTLPGVDGADADAIVMSHFRTFLEQDTNEFGIYVFLEVMNNIKKHMDQYGNYNAYVEVSFMEMFDGFLFAYLGQGSPVQVKNDFVRVYKTYMGPDEYVYLWEIVKERIKRTVTTLQDIHAPKYRLLVDEDTRTIILNAELL